MTRVLVVDDSPVMRRYVARSLGMTGMDVHIYEAGNGREATVVAASIRPHLVITDLNMPEMSGSELVSWLHADPCLKDTPVLVLSADQGKSRPRELIGAGAVAYLTKPATPEVLRRSLVAAMAGRASDGGAEFE